MASSTRRKYSPRLPREERREQLLDAALDLLAAEGFGGISMEAVAREAEIAKTVVYDAFANKEELLQALLEREQQHAFTDIVAALPKPPLEGDPLAILGESITAFLDAVRRRPASWRLILLPAEGTPPSVRAYVDRNRELLLRQIEPMVAWGEKQLGLEQVDPELTAYTILALAESSARLTLTQPRRFPPKRIADFTSDMLAVIARGRPRGA
jgi:AcrR family transcriptional regulator